jgi:hypothetical protein
MPICARLSGELSSIGTLSLARLPRPPLVCLARVVSLLAFDSALFKDIRGWRAGSRRLV